MPSAPPNPTSQNAHAAFSRIGSAPAYDCNSFPRLLHASRRRLRVIYSCRGFEPSIPGNWRIPVYHCIAVAPHFNISRPPSECHLTFCGGFPRIPRCPTAYTMPPGKDTPGLLICFMCHHPFSERRRRTTLTAVLPHHHPVLAGSASGNRYASVRSASPYPPSPCRLTCSCQNLSYTRAPYIIRRVYLFSPR